MRTEAETLKLWLLNDEGLYMLISDAALNTPEGDVDLVTDGLSEALGFDNLTPFQLEFMPNLSSFEVRAMIAGLIDEHRAEWTTPGYSDFSGEGE